MTSNVWFGLFLLACLFVYKAFWIKGVTRKVKNLDVWISEVYSSPTGRCRLRVYYTKRGQLLEMKRAFCSDSNVVVEFVGRGPDGKSRDFSRAIEICEEYSVNWTVTEPKKAKSEKKLIVEVGPNREKGIMFVMSIIEDGLGFPAEEIIYAFLDVDKTIPEIMGSDENTNGGH